MMTSKYLKTRSWFSIASVVEMLHLHEYVHMEKEIMHIRSSTFANNAKKKATNK